MTPGPWRYSADINVQGNPIWRIEAPTVSALASLSYADGVDRAVGEPDARLIAAAPELLTMLKRALDVIDAAERTYGWAWVDKNEADVLLAEIDGRNRGHE